MDKEKDTPEGEGSIDGRCLEGMTWDACNNSMAGLNTGKKASLDEDPELFFRRFLEFQQSKGRVVPLKFYKRLLGHAADLIRRRGKPKRVWKRPVTEFNKPWKWISTGTDHWTIVDR